MWDTASHVMLDTAGVAPFLGVQRDVVGGSGGSWERMLQGTPLVKRRVRRKQHVIRAGQPFRGLFLVQSGVFKSALISEDGRERVTAFPMRGELLGQEALDLAVYPCHVTALDDGEVWELQPFLLRQCLPGFQERLSGMLASEIRRDWQWMLALGSLNAEQRVTSFLLDYSTRLAERGFSATQMLLCMTRADIGSFLAMQIETVVRTLHRLQDQGLIEISRSHIRIVDLPSLRAQSKTLN
ncbi:helix-turn-helix domain-containing protein [Stenotrophomonas sp.]|uniref:helix-turn-helix domain-containing protein n=1 Tax=Stenotrophomonas sp. TaxID=69392 RepID=UPI00199F8CE1|nr:helix-turn-helix domain-containing protein [Stenotrophomonas sp.]MBD3826838.1 helix-turn-helix domain-containing protein [Stenotrophomonas sp.]